jgi:hypothetical protein
LQPCFPFAFKSPAFLPSKSSRNQVFSAGKAAKGLVPVGIQKFVGINKSEQLYPIISIATFKLVTFPIYRYLLPPPAT